MSLQRNLPDDEGIIDLAGALRSNRSLAILNMSECNLTDVNCPPLAAALKKNGALKELDLNRNLLTNTGAESLLSSFGTNLTLNTLR